MALPLAIAEACIRTFKNNPTDDDPVRFETTTFCTSSLVAVPRLIVNFAINHELCLPGGSHRQHL